MPDITTQIKTAVGGEPPLGFGPADVIAAAHRVRRRRRARYAAAAAGVSAVTAAAVLAIPGRPAGPPAGQAAQMSLTSLSRIAGKQPAGAARGPSTARVNGVTAAEVFSLFERDAGVRVTDAQVSLLRPPGELDLTAGVAVPGHPYLNIQVTPKTTMSTAMPACAELSDLTSGSGDGYYGPCSVRRLADGSILVARSGETKQGHFAMAQATLIRPDGSGVFAEDTNQAMATAGGRAAREKAESGGKLGLPPVVRAHPPVGAGTLAAFVRDVAARF